MYVGEHFCSRDGSDVYFLVSRKLKRSVLSVWRNYNRLLIVQCSSYIAWKRSRADCRFCLIYYRVSCSLQKSNCHWTERVRYFFRKCYAKVNDRVELFELFCTFIRCGSEVETTHVQSSKRTPVLFPAIIFVLHAEICVSRCEGCASFGLFWSLDRPCSYLLSSLDRYIFFFFFSFLSAGFSRMSSSVEHVCVFRPESSFWIEQRASHGVD